MGDYILTCIMLIDDGMGMYGFILGLVGALGVIFNKVFEFLNLKKEIKELKELIDIQNNSFEKNIKKIKDEYDTIIKNLKEERKDLTENFNEAKQNLNLLFERISTIKDLDIKEFDISILLNQAKDNNDEE